MPILKADMPVILALLLIFSFLAPVFSQDLPVSRIPDDSHLRIRLKDTWFTEAPNRVLARIPRIENLENGDRVEVKIMEGRDEFMIVLSRELSRTGHYPGWAQGSWMLTRRKDTGAPTLIRIFLRSDQQTHIQFRPFDNEKCFMDVVLYGGFLARSLTIPVPFERLYTMQLNDILRLAGDKFPRHYFDPDPALYRDSRTFISNVRANLSGLRFTDDGALNEKGEYVFIETLQRQNASTAGLNCSGFLKWLVDGMLRPVTGQRLAIAPLKEPFGERGSSFTVNWEHTDVRDRRRDPYFGLDWIRHLASHANAALRSGAHSELVEFEVRADKFSFLMVNNNRTFVSYPGFMGEAGYGIEGLYPLLYTLAIDEPFSFYLAAVSNEQGAQVTQDNPRGAPRLRQYFHVAALVPYFDESGVFRVVVFESAEETSFNGFRTRYPGHFINLVQVPVTTVFTP